MVKYIPTRKLSHEKEVAALQREIEELKKQLGRSRAENERLRSSSDGTPKSSATRKPRRPTAAGEPSYLQHTAAFKGKSVEADTPRGLGPSSSTGPDLDQSEMYNDGKLVRVEAPRIYDAHYFKATEAFSNRTIDVLFPMPRGAPPDDWYSPLNDDENLLWKTHPKEPVAATADPRRRGKLLDSVEDKNKARRDQLTRDSRLDDGLTRTPINLPFRDLHNKCKAGIRIAQDIIFGAVRKHYPEQSYSWWREGPRLVSLGRDELINYFGAFDSENNMKPPNLYNEIGGVSRESTNFAMHMITKLRNDVFHQHYVDTATTDERLQRVQNLAIELLDETRAFQIRRLRDDLKAQVSRSLEEIERLYGTQWDPENRNRTWKTHHRFTFGTIIDDSDRRTVSGYDRYPAFLKEAAWDYHFRSHGRMFSNYDHEYISLLDKARKHARDTRRELTKEEIDAAEAERLAALEAMRTPWWGEGETD